jgi:hypothetical protein
LEFELPPLGGDLYAASFGRVAFTADKIPMPIMTIAPARIQWEGICIKRATYTSPTITIA